MRKKKLNAVIDKADELGTAAADLLSTLNAFEDEAGSSFDIKKPIRGRDSSTSQIISRIQAAVGIIAEFRAATRPELVPLQVLANLETAQNELLEAIKKLAGSVSTIGKQGGLKSFNYGNFNAQAKNGSAHNMQGAFHALFDKSEAFLERVFESVSILKPRGAYSFQSAANALATTIEDATSRLNALKASLKTVTVSEKELAEKNEQAKGHLDEINRLKSEAGNDRKSVADYLAEITQQKAAVQAAHDEAASLQSAVREYQAAFEQFQKKLDDREAAFTDGTEKLDSLIERFNNQRDTVEGLIERSNQMLESATVSGLASNFAAMMEKLTTELKWARRAFYTGIVFLTVSAIPLLGFVLLPLIAPFLADFSPELLSTALRYGPGAAETGWQYVGQVIARIIILLPAAWFVSFAAIRHSSLFRLREHYAYKYSMAVAVEGFKQQAPDYEQEIAALVLEQLAFNPADKLIPSKEIKEGRAPISGYLLEKIRFRLDKPAPAETGKR